MSHKKTYVEYVSPVFNPCDTTIGDSQQDLNSEQRGCFLVCADRKSSSPAAALHFLNQRMSIMDEILCHIRTVLFDPGRDSFLLITDFIDVLKPITHLVSALRGL